MTPPLGVFLLVGRRETVRNRDVTAETTVDVLLLFTKQPAMGRSVPLLLTHDVKVYNFMKNGVFHFRFGKVTAIADAKDEVTVMTTAPKRARTFIGHFSHKRTRLAHLEPRQGQTSLKAEGIVFIELRYNVF